MNASPPPILVPTCCFGPRRPCRSLRPGRPTFSRACSIPRAEAGSALVLGIPDITPDPATPNVLRFQNTAQVLGAGSGRYVKHHLVPFGEYVPLEGLLRG